MGQLFFMAADPQGLIMDPTCPATFRVDVIVGVVRPALVRSASSLRFDCV